MENIERGEILTAQGGVRTHGQLALGHLTSNLPNLANTRVHLDTRYTCVCR